ncbi:hypothetical protein M434DRAFT_15619 [Hypoxylon sp. CO27-5]|nr:hypothetical protein M434DRAFT_15619 [Hypoxylon sp. CO27-5]
MGPSFRILPSRPTIPQTFLYIKSNRSPEINRLTRGAAQWVITNVSTSFYSIDLAPGFFKWGYAWPLHHIVQASRQILFDLHSEIGLNFGVLFAWTAVNVCLFPLCCYFMRWKQERQRRNAERGAESYSVFDAAAEGQKKNVPKEKGTLPPVRKRGFMRGV